VDPINRLEHAERAMLRAPSHALAETIRDILGSAYGAKSADILLVDYRMSVLQPVLGEAAQHPVGASPAGSGRSPSAPRRSCR
jgi:hypothetical protein